MREKQMECTPQTYKKPMKWDRKALFKLFYFFVIIENKFFEIVFKMMNMSPSPDRSENPYVLGFGI
jgi:hypothetical protein